MPADRPARAGHELRAWRPAVDGVTEVLHARFTDHVYPMHAHDAWTVLIIDDGVVRYDLDRHRRGAFGELVTVLPPHVPHNGGAAGAGGFRKRVLYLEAGRLPADAVGPSVDHPGFADAALRAMISRLHDVVAVPGERMHAESLLAVVRRELLLHLGRDTTGPEPGPGVAHRLRDLLEDRVVAGLPLAEAGRLLHVDPAHLVRSFHRTFGMAPHRYLTSRRVDLARRLILTGQPLPAVATASGFYDQSHLTRHFRRILGISPGRYARTR
ncbi:AraC family transcriptional regulator [Mangrovihabitans endophyticus]|uniref:AraC family transcriptional regulator n=1 Tax=Mangrovihabitans endophyticus TaxID=1751298 RepID=UPI001E636B89